MNAYLNRLRASKFKHGLLIAALTAATIGSMTDGKPRLLLNTAAGTFFLIWVVLGDWD